MVSSDVVASWTPETTYPPVVGVVVRAGRCSAGWGRRHGSGACGRTGFTTGPRSRRSPSAGRARRVPRFYGLFTVQLLVGAAAALAPANLVQLAVSMQVLNGVITPVRLVYVLVLAHRRRVLGAAANGPLFRVVATACIVVIAVMAAAVVVLHLAGVT